MGDREVGDYDAPALVMQEGVVRLLMEPIARSAIGAEGVVDLYRMPAYDDVAGLFFSDGRWMIDFRRPDGSPGPDGQDGAIPLDEATFREAIAAMGRPHDERS